MLKEKKLSGHIVSDVRFIHTQLPVTIKANDSICSILKENLLELPVVDNKNKIIGQVDASEIIAFSMAYNK